MNEQRMERAGPGGIVVWLAVIAALCLALTVGVAAEMEAQEYQCQACHVARDSKPVCAFHQGSPACLSLSWETCSAFGFAWAILTGDVEACQGRTETWYWN